MSSLVAIYLVQTQCQVKHHLLYTVLYNVQYTLCIGHTTCVPISSKRVFQCRLYPGVGSPALWRPDQLHRGRGAGGYDGSLLLDPLNILHTQQV